MADVDSGLYAAFGQSLVSTIYSTLNQYRVVLEAAPRWWQTPATLASVNVGSGGGAGAPRCPLNAVARTRTTDTTLVVNHQSQFPAVTVSFNLAPGASLGDAVDAVSGAAAAIGLPQRHPGLVSGHGAGVPGVAQQSGVARARGADGGLHRAGRALRELHPSPHHSVDAALGGRGRAAGAARHAHGADRDCDHRHHPADRHREEERDHDDRLRARRRTPRREGRRATRSTRPACSASVRS